MLGFGFVPMTVASVQERCMQGFECIFRFPNDTMPFIPHEYWTGGRYKFPGKGCYKHGCAAVCVLHIRSKDIVFTEDDVNAF